MNTRMVLDKRDKNGRIVFVAKLGMNFIFLNCKTKKVLFVNLNHLERVKLIILNVKKAIKNFVFCR